MVGPNPLKRFKPKTHERIGLKAHETKGRKEKTQPAKIRKSKRSPVIRTRPGYPGTARSSGSSGHVAKLRSAQKHKERRTDTSLSTTK